MASTEVILTIKCDENAEDAVTDLLFEQAQALRDLLDSLLDPGASITVDAPEGLHETF